MEYKLDKSLGDFFPMEEMKNHISFRVGGPADLFIKPRNEESLIRLIKEIRESSYRYYILGNATNVIFKDEGYRGIVIFLKGALNEIEISGEKLKAACGASLKDIAQAAYENSLTGLEFSHGIPGSLGGAVTMNAGAYDGEMKDVIESVKILDKDGNIKEFSRNEMHFAYRGSRVSEEKFLVLSATFSLKRGDRESIKNKMDDFDTRRKDKQPLNYPSAGSTFKRPEGYFAGKLIDDSGLRGFRHGHAGVSEKHCGFVINYGDASAKEILETIAIVQKTVYDKFKVNLEREVKIIEWYRSNYFNRNEWVRKK